MILLHGIRSSEFTGLTNKRLKPELLDYLNARIQNKISESAVKLSDKGQLCISGTVIYLVDEFSNKQILLQLELHDYPVGEELSVF